MDFFAGDYLGTEPYLDDMYYEPEQPDLFFPDPMSDTSLIASGLSDSSSSEAAGSSNWDSLTEFYTSESFFPQDFCQAQSENPFGDDGFADDWMLRARDDGAATCEYPKSDQTPNLDPDIMLRLDQNIPKVFAPLDLKKPKKDVPPPPDPNRRIVKEYEECFLPYLTRCCCTGFSAWGDYTIWGDTLAQINECSVGTFMSLGGIRAGRYSVD